MRELALKIVRPLHHQPRSSNIMASVLVFAQVAGLVIMAKVLVSMREDAQISTMEKRRPTLVLIK